MTEIGNVPELLPVVVLVHDAWHTPAHYSTFIDTLAILGYPIACPQLLTAHTDSNCTSSFNDDCSLIYQLVFDFCGDGNDVLVIGHGYGAFVATEVLGDLSKQERQRIDRPGGVIGLVALAGLLPDQGETFKDVITGQNNGERPGYLREQVTCPLPFHALKRAVTHGYEEYELTVSNAKKDATLRLVQPGTFLYNDLGPMDREHWSSHLVRFTANPSEIFCTSTPAWRAIPTTYIICEDDHYIPANLQRSIAEKTDSNIFEIEDIGHDPFIGKCEDLVEIVGTVVAWLYAESEPDGLVKHEKAGHTGIEREETNSDAGSAKSAPEEKNAEDVPFGKPLRRTTTAPC